MSSADGLKVSPQERDSIEAKRLKDQLAGYILDRIDTNHDKTISAEEAVASDFIKGEIIRLYNGTSDLRTIVFNQDALTVAVQQLSGVDGDTVRAYMAEQNFTAEAFDLGRFCEVSGACQFTKQSAAQGRSNEV